ncbi:hypothetical protein [Bacillus mycoides]
MSYETVDNLSHESCDRLADSVMKKLNHFVTILFNNIGVKVSV